MYLNGPLPEPMSHEEMWAGNRYRPMNQGQLCHASDWIDWQVGRVPCKEDAYMMIGGIFMGNHIGFCGKHWLRFLDALRSELVEARGDDHWLIQHVMEHYGPNILEQTREAAQRKEREDRRRRLNSRRYRREGAVLADAFLDGPRVYFIQAGKRGPIKIGFARDVLKRLESLQTGNAQRLRIQATVPGGESLEREYHHLFAGHRISGEWFKPVVEIRNEIKAINAVKRRGEGALF